MCKIEHVGRISQDASARPLACEWGLSLHLESEATGRTTQSVSTRFRLHTEILVRNFDLLGIEPERLNGLILSHGHRDHYGGLAGFVAHYRAAARRSGLFRAGRRPFARNGSARATKSLHRGEHSTERHSRLPKSKRFTASALMGSMARSPLAI